MQFDEAFDLLLGHEGDFVDHPNDPGGATRWGITERVARKYGYAGRMQDFPVEFAKRIAKADYWDAVRADELPAAVRFEVFDGAYNSGAAQSIKWLQRAASTVDDGKLGPATLAAVWARNPEALAARYNGHRLDMLNDLKNWASFGRGWAQRIADNLMRVKG
jgi:lysozyme family protein